MCCSIYGDQTPYGPKGVNGNEFQVTRNYLGGGQVRTVETTINVLSKAKIIDMEEVHETATTIN